MAIIEFTFDRLEDIGGGRVAEALRQALARAVFDCKDRPAEKNPRKVILQAELVPLVDEDGQADSVDLTFQVKDTVPTRKSKTYNMGLRGDHLSYSTESPDHFAQKTRDFDEVDV
ncbi:MAG: hypothetical protein ACYS5V_02925, partial [Planctomycetota bacterium]